MNRNTINNKVSLYLNDFKATAISANNEPYEADEIVMMCLERFLRLDDDKVLDMVDRGGIKSCRDYIAKSILRSKSSDTSDYHYSINKNNEDKITDMDDKDLENIPNSLSESPELDILDTVLDNDIYWYNAILYRMSKLEGMTYDEISKKTTIARNSIVDTVLDTHAEVLEYVERRKLSQEKLDDYGILTEQEYKNKHRSYDTPSLSYFNLLQVLTTYKGSKTEAAAYFKLPVKDISKACKEWNIDITSLSHITKDMLEESIFNSYGNIAEAAKVLKVKRASMRYLTVKHDISNEWIINQRTNK